MVLKVTCMFRELASIHQPGGIGVELVTRYRSVKAIIQFPLHA